MGTLYIVATPIGNLEDLSPRAVRIMGEVGLIAAEDTRRTRKLLSYFKISTSLTSYFDHNKIKKLDSILLALSRGDVALVSDGGMPTISDPGYQLVRSALESGYKVLPVPGPSALLAALSVSGLPTDAFVYLGFLPRKSSERKRVLSDNSADKRTLVFFESPYRLLDSLNDIETELGNRPIAIGRELTKLHEEVFRGDVRSAIVHYNSSGVQGEVTLVVGGRSKALVNKWNNDETLACLKACVQSGKTLSEASREVAKKSGWSRKDVYSLGLQD
jgi:16S rRNA (cytidine1402-2'-O)-methyltransferase